MSDNIQICWWFGDEPPPEVAPALYAHWTLKEAEVSIEKAWTEANQAIEYLGRFMIPMLDLRAWNDVLEQLTPFERTMILNAARVAGVYPGKDPQ